MDASGPQEGQPRGAAEGVRNAAAWRNEINGVVRGPVVQAQTIHGDVRITVGPRPEAPGPPSLLPAVPANFCGRVSEMAMLDQLAFEFCAARRLAVIVIVGPGGVGKTSLAAHWLHSVKDLYPDGVLSADLGGDRVSDPARPGDVLDGFLRALAVAPDGIPVTVQGQAALFRSLTAGRRMVIFLDNAASAAQVRVLLPGQGPPETEPGSPGEPGRRPVVVEPQRPSLVVVTSRWRIAGLAMDGARFVDLEPLDTSAATELFGRVVGVDRVAAEEAASREVVRLCGGIPLAVCVSGARLAAHPRWPVGRIAGELAAERARLSALSLSGDVSVRAAFDASYQALAGPAALAYRAVALIPGPDFCADLAVAALDDQEHGQELLDTLVDASLLAETRDGRYRQHDLVRLHAREQSSSVAAAGGHDVVARSVAWYLRQAVAADMVVLPGRWRLGPLYEQETPGRPAYGSPAEAASWLESRLPGLVAAVHAAHDAGLHPQAWQLCEALWGVLLFGKHYPAWLDSHQVGLHSARICGDQRAEAQMNIQFGAAHRSLGNLETADENFTRALELFRGAGHRLGEASALDQLGVARLRRACYDQAISDFTQALAIHRAIGRPRGIALMTFNIGQALAASGRQDESIRYLYTADRQFAAIGESYHQARVLTVLGGVLIGSGRAREAEEPLLRALAIAGELGAAYDRAHVHVRLADLADALGQPGRAVPHLEQALALFSQVKAPLADSVRARLSASVGQPVTGAADSSEHEQPSDKRRAG